MNKGRIVSIHTAPSSSVPMTSVAEAQAVPGKGLEGDRYFHETGTFSEKIRGPDREVTLIELEALEALERDYSVTLQPARARRNLVTRGVALNHLVGREFAVGGVILRGLRLCEPCSHLAKWNHRENLRGLVHRGGLRAQILVGGTIRVGDEVGEPCEGAAS